MFAVVRTGGKQYRVAPGDKIVVEKLDGEAGSRIDLGDVLLAGNGSDLQSVDGLTVAAEIVAHAKADKVTIFKKRRRHNYRRKKGHRQQHTILKIVAIGDQRAEDRPKAAPAAAAAPASEGSSPPEASGNPDVRGQIDTVETPNPAPDAAAAKPARAKKAAAAGSTENAAPAKGGAKKSAKAPKAE